MLLAVAGCTNTRRGSRGSAGCEMPIDLRSAASVEADGTLRYSGILAGTESVQRGSCGGSGVETVLEYVPDRSGPLDLSTDNLGTEIDTVVYVRTSCDDEGSELGCDDDGGSGVSSRLTVDATAGVPIYIFVDAYSSTGTGGFELTVRGTGIAPMDAGAPDAGPGGPPSSCASPLDLDSLASRKGDGSLRYADTNRGGLWASEGSCGGRGPDSVLVYTPDRSGTLTASTDDPATSFDTVVYVRTSCTMPSTEIGCDDDSGLSTSSSATAPVTAGVPVYVFVDGYGARSEGEYVLHLRIDEGPPVDGGPPDGGPMDGGFDAGRDAGPPDAGPVDGGPCTFGTADCDGDMICETATDTLTNCGGCGIACTRANATATCAGSVCRIASCSSGFGNCDGSDFNGCETPTASTAAHCGGCGMACVMRPNSVPSCSMSICDFTCSPGFDDCNRVFTDGCEVDIDASTSNCGMCGNDCPFAPGATRVCTAGTCGFLCSGATGDCNGLPGDGCETDTSSDVGNCGGCGMTCPPRPNATSDCVSSLCGFTCSPGFGDCNGSATDGCETNTTATAAHCGGCGAACPARPNTTPSCASSTCSYACSSGFDDCDGLPSNGCEISTATDRNNCGMCGRRCPGMQVCCSGVCQASCP